MSALSSVLPQGLDSYAWIILGVLAAVSVLALTVSLYKVAQFARLGVGRRRTARAVLDRWQAGDADAALALAARRDCAAVRVLHATLAARQAHPHDRGAVRERATQAALDELSTLTGSMRALEAVVQAAPMLGLLGTVVGMIEAFGRLSRAAGAVDPSVLAGGIWTALITTAVGLAIAIFFYFVAIWLEGRITAERETYESLISAVLHGGPPADGLHAPVPPMAQPAPPQHVAPPPSHPARA